MQIMTKLDTTIVPQLSEIANIPFFIAGYKFDSWQQKEEGKEEKVTKENLIIAVRRVNFAGKNAGAPNEAVEEFKTSSNGIMKFFKDNQTMIDTELSEVGIIKPAVMLKIGSSANGLFHYLESVGDEE